MGQCSTLPAQEGHSNMYNNGDTVDNSNHSSSNWPVQQRDDVAASHQQRYRASSTVTPGVGKLHHHHLNTNQHNAMNTPSDDPTTPLTARHRSNQNSTSGYHLQVETIEQQQQQQKQHTHHVPSDQFGQMHVVDVNPPMSSPASNNNATGYAGQPQMMHGKTAGVGESSPMSPRLRRRHHHHQSNQQQNISSPLGGIEEQLVQPKQEPEIPLPPPPENAVRKRCYKLNLESDVIGTTNNNENSANPGVKGRQPLMGPFLDDPPPLTYSSSDDSSAGVTSTTVAVETAQIFRGIVVSKDAMIIKQNARASRGGSSGRAGAAGSSSSKQKQKRGEKSRQASKIDKAKDRPEHNHINNNNSTLRQGNQRQRQCLLAIAAAAPSVPPCTLSLPKSRATRVIIPPHGEYFPTSPDRKLNKHKLKRKRKRQKCTTGWTMTMMVVTGVRH
mmetsp:Transcript_2082/g.2855  ORF Transcript_2082/g.2855 Transcript_2082/m.2855 type:complete len:443 (-) Transcript_2082:381-1709(-)